MPDNNALTGEKLFREAALINEDKLRPVLMDYENMDHDRFFRRGDYRLRADRTGGMPGRDCIITVLHRTAERAQLQMFSQWNVRAA